MPLKKNLDRIVPQDVYRSGFMGSRLKDTQLEMFLSCIAITQFKMNPEAWTPFTWEEYVAKCNHHPIQKEKEILDVMTNGGNVELVDISPISKNHSLEPGYFKKDGVKYIVTEKLISVMADATQSLQSR